MVLCSVDNLADLFINKSAKMKYLITFFKMGPTAQETATVKCMAACLHGCRAAESTALGSCILVHQVGVFRSTALPEVPDLHDFREERNIHR